MRDSIAVHAATTAGKAIVLLSLLYIVQLLGHINMNTAEAAALREETRDIYASLSSGDRTGGIAGTDSNPYESPPERTVYLTFDDGPSGLTPEVLDILKEYKVNATFFVLGKLAKDQEATVRRIVNEGHAIGNHTYDHDYDHLYKNFMDFWGQVRKTEDILEQITGEQVRLLRAPGGTARNFDAFYFYYLQEAGYLVHDWNVDSGDSRRRGVPASEILRNVKQSKLPHEVTVLMHDGAGHKETVKALPEIIRYFKGKGYRFAVLDDKVKPVTFRLGKTRWSRSMSEQQHKQALEAIADAGKKQQPKAEAREWIALRDWAPGRTITWNPISKIAEVTLGGKLLVISANTGKAVQMGPGPTPYTAVNLSLRFEDNRFYVLKSDAEAIMTS